MSFAPLFKENVPTLEQLHCLIRFVDGGSLSAVFGEGKSAQNRATNMLGRIDRCFGIRTRRSDGALKVPTAEAEQLAEICRDFLLKLTDYKARAEESPDTFEIGAGDMLTFYVLIPALNAAGAWRQKVQLHLQNLRSQQIVTGLLAGTLDVGLVRTTAVDELVRKGRLQAQRICHIDYVVCIRRSLLTSYTGNPSDEDGLAKWCLSNYPLATFWAESSTFTSALAKTGISLPVQLRCESFPQALEAIVSGGYCGIVPQIAVSGSRAQELFTFGRRLLRDTGRDVALVWNSSLTQRRKGGENALNVLRNAIRDSIRPALPIEDQTDPSQSRMSNNSEAGPVFMKTKPSRARVHAI